MGCPGRRGFCRIFEQFPRFEFFLLTRRVTCPPKTDPIFMLGSGQGDRSPVVAVLPHSEEMMALGSREIFSLRYPDHPITTLYHEALNKLME